MRPARLANLTSGRGRLSGDEARRLQEIKTNSVAIANLKRKNEGKRSYRVNRALRTWLDTGKEKDDKTKQDEERKLKAIRALSFLGIDPSEGTYYVRKRKAA